MHPNQLQNLREWVQLRDQLILEARRQMWWEAFAKNEAYRLYEQTGDERLRTVM